MALEAFRAEARAWREENCSASMREPAAEDQIIGGGKRQEYEPDTSDPGIYISLRLLTFALIFSAFTLLD